MDLADIRVKIDKIDEKLANLFEERMEMAKRVAEYKLSVNAPIFNETRENAILDKTKERFSEDLKYKAISLYSQLMLLSREYQYEYMIKSGVDPKYIKAFEPSVNYIEEKVCYYGDECSWSNIAADKLCKGKKLSGASDFETVFENVATGKFDAGVLPIDNSTHGTVREVYDLLLKYNLYISASCKLDIKYCLVAKDGVDINQIKYVYSHPQALSQCKDYIRQKGFIPKEYENTAGAAKFISKGNDLCAAALCNDYAVIKYNLQIIDKEIRDSKMNTTRFIKVTRKPLVTEKSDIVSIAFNLQNKSGTLSGILSIFKDYNVNLLKIESRPIPSKPFEYSFYLDFEGNIFEERIKSILLQLEHELPELYILGNYTII